MKTLSKSVIIMFLYDALIFGLSSYFWYAKFNLTSKMLIPAVLLIVATGLFTLFLKANYKIREFNNTLKNCYLYSMTGYMWIQVFLTNKPLFQIYLKILNFPYINSNFNVQSTLSSKSNLNSLFLTW